MAKGGKLTKLLKRMQSFGRQSNSRSVSTGIGNINAFTSPTIKSCRSDSSSERTVNLHPVYVGKSRRRYLISTDVIHHPLFREIAVRSSSSRPDEDDSDEAITVGCEVVLFEHLLWMLENADSHEPGSLQDLVDFYASN